MQVWVKLYQYRRKSNFLRRSINELVSQYNTQYNYSVKQKVIKFFQEWFLLLIKSVIVFVYPTPSAQLKIRAQ